MNIKKEINSLCVNKQVKQKLLELNYVAASENEVCKRSVPGLFMVSPKGAGISKVAEVYSHIIDVNGVYQLKGTGTFLELEFPKGATDRVYQSFFQSPTIVAATQNRFYGTFMISFSEWDGNDLLKDPMFGMLLNYLCENKDNISFIFHITPNFTAKKELLSKLKKYVSLMELELERPNLEQSMEYITAHLQEADMRLTVQGKTELCKLLDDLIVSDIYMGYTSLDMLVQNLQYETAISNLKIDTEYRNVTVKIIHLIADKIEEELYAEDQVKIGFRI